MPYKPEGDLKQAKYIIVAEAPARMEMIYGRPLQGPSGQLFDSCLNMAGVARAECYLTNVFDFMVNKSKAGVLFNPDSNEMLYHPRNGYTEEGRKSVRRLKEELQGANANIILALGAIAGQALGNVPTIGKWRGSVLKSTLMPGRKFIPTYHPAASLRGQYTWRYIITDDIKRMRGEGTHRELIGPNYNFLLAPSFDEAIDYLRWIYKEKPLIAVDIEVQNMQTSAISFSPDGEDCMSIIFEKFTPEQELRVWLGIAHVMQDVGIEKIFHNRMFDTWFLLTQNSIYTRGVIHDTMIMQHVMYPDFLRRLPFITSIYTNQPYYKDMVKFKKADIGKEEG